MYSTSAHHASGSYDQNMDAPKIVHLSFHSIKHHHLMHPLLQNCTPVFNASRLHYEGAPSSSMPLEIIPKLSRRGLCMSEVAHQLQFLFHGGRKRKHCAVPLPNLHVTMLLRHVQHALGSGICSIESRLLSGCRALGCKDCDPAHSSKASADITKQEKSMFGGP